MARYSNNPNAHSKAITFRYIKYLAVLLVIIVIGCVVYINSGTNSILLALVGFLLVPIFMYFSEHIFAGDSRNDQGKIGEYQVKELLLTLPDTFVVFQNVQVRKNLDIDFIVVGPTGVFSVEVKSHSRVNSWQWTKFINQTISETMSLKKILSQSGVSVYIKPILVYTRAPLKYAYNSKGVEVLPKSMLIPSIINNGKVVYNQAKIEEVINNIII